MYKLQFQRQEDDQAPCETEPGWPSPVLAPQGHWPFNMSQQNLLEGTRMGRCRQRRSRAATMEKQRQSRINDAILRLRQVIPEEYVKGERMTKARTIRLAAQYMHDLSKLLMSLPRATSSPGPCMMIPPFHMMPSPVQPSYFPPSPFPPSRQSYVRSLPEQPMCSDASLGLPDDVHAMRACARYYMEGPEDLSMPVFGYESPEQSRYYTYRPSYVCDMPALSAHLSAPAPPAFTMKHLVDKVVDIEIPVSSPASPSQRQDCMMAGGIITVDSESECDK